MSDQDQALASQAPVADTSAPAAEAPAEAEQSTPAASEPNAPQTDPEAALDAKLEAIFDKNNPTRDDGGRFKSTKPEEVAAEPKVTPDQAQQQETVEQPKTEEASSETVAIDPPNAWSADMKAKWSSLPPEVRDYVRTREGESHAAITRMGQELSGYRPLGELIRSHRDTFERHRADPVTGINRLLDVQRALDRDAPGTIAAIAELYGVDLQQFAGQPQAEAASQEDVPPQVRSLMQRLDHMERQQAERQRQEAEAERRAKETARQQNEALQQQTAEDVAKWSVDKEHYEAVRADMALMIASGRVENLDDAYERACYANPEVRSKVLEKQQKESETKRLAEAQKKVAEAKRAAPLNTGTTRRAASAPAGKWDSDSYLESVFDRAQKG